MKRETFAYLLTISQKEYKKTKKKEGKNGRAS